MSKCLTLVVTVLLLAFWPWQSERVHAEPPTNPVATFSTAKKIARDTIYRNDRKTLYCGCKYTRNRTGTGGRINHRSCGYKTRKNKKRAKRLEWEHVMPAYFFGHERKCWQEGHQRCVGSKGAYAGRRCCAKVDVEFKRMEADLHNLVPAVGEVNGDRSNHPYGIVSGLDGLYGRCDFKVGGRPRMAQPTRDIRGDVARVWFYMAETYDVDLPDPIVGRLQEWVQADPVDDWERKRDVLIKGEQGNSNPRVTAD